MIVTPKQIEKENPIKIIVTNYIKLRTFNDLTEGYTAQYNFWGLVMRTREIGCELLRCEELPGHAKWAMRILTLRMVTSQAWTTRIVVLPSFLADWNARRVSQTTLYSTIGGLIPEPIGERNSENTSTLMLKMLKAWLFCPANLPIAILKKTVGPVWKLPNCHAASKHMRKQSMAPTSMVAPIEAHEAYLPICALDMTDSHW